MKNKFIDSTVKKRFSLSLVLCLLTAALTACSSETEYISFSDETETPEVFSRQTETEKYEEPAAEEETDPTMIVHVCGAVCNPGVYSLREGDRVYDAVDSAGGFSEDADCEWVNQATILHDGDKLTIYSQSETARFREQGITSVENYSGITSSGYTSALESADGLININTAGVSELTELPGIGEARAGDIISYRSRHGAFSSIEQIKEVSGIGDALFNKICDLITV